jgi:virginiamycin A acetyltransferase
MRESFLGESLFRASASRRLARRCLRLSLAFEGGQFYSVTARRIMEARWGVSIGAYSYGPCFEPGTFGPGTVIGRYVSIGPRLRAYQANHPLDRLSTHPFFFNRDLGIVRETNVPLTSLMVEHDAWIGESVIITPGCRRIGLGSVIGAGSIVTKDVPDFAVAAGNPARIIKSRFSDEIQESLRKSQWWELPVSECTRYLDFMTAPLSADAPSHPMLMTRES